LAKKPELSIRMGALEWERYTYARPADADLTLIGSVRDGQQMGALAQTSDGKYVQVVGDFMVPLSSSKVAKALAKTQGKPVAPAFFAPLPSSSPPKPAPVVTIKRRRVFVLPS